MRGMLRNQHKFWYVLYKGKEPVVDEYGNETGESKVAYESPVSMKASISSAFGSSQIEQFGSLDTYDKVIITHDMKCPIDENSVLFIDKEPAYMADGTPLYDYVVKRVARSLNNISYAVSKVKVS